MDISMTRFTQKREIESRSLSENNEDTPSRIQDNATIKSLSVKSEKNDQDFVVNPKKKKRKALQKKLENQVAVQKEEVMKEKMRMHHIRIRNI